MMKCIFVVVLLQVCYSLPMNMTPNSFTPDVTMTSFIPDPNLNSEILNQLKELNKHINHTKLKSIPTPGHYMLYNTSKCVDVFSQELVRFLGNMTQEGPVKDIIGKLEPKLKFLAKHPQNNKNCKMTSDIPRKNPFRKHMEFIRRLNSRR